MAPEAASVSEAGSAEASVGEAAGRTEDDADITDDIDDAFDDATDSGKADTPAPMGFEGDLPVTPLLARRGRARRR